MSLSALYYSSLRGLRLTTVARRLRHAGPILCYHNVVASQDERLGEGSLHIPVEDFARQVEWLASRYDVVPLTEYITRLFGGGRLKSVAAITFDDAYLGVFEHAVPLLKQRGLPATVFVVANASASGGAFWWDHPEVAAVATPERRGHWLTNLKGDAASIAAEVRASDALPLPRSHYAAQWPTIRRHLGGGLAIGVHSATHRSMPTLSREELACEIVTSRETIQRATGVRPTVFAYPYGLSSPAVRAAVKAAGYRAACGLEYGLNDPHADPWALRRVNVPAGISDAAFEGWTTGFGRPWRSE